MQRKDRWIAKSCTTGRYEIQVDCKLDADLLAMQVQPNCATEKQKSQMQEANTCCTKTLPESHIQTVCAMCEAHHSME